MNGAATALHDARRSGAGFTLVEILVVLVIIGVMIAGAVLAIGVAGRDRALETDAGRLAALLDYAREQAELQSRDFGLRVTTDRYTFFAFEPITGQWLEIAEDALRERNLADGLGFDLTLEGRPVVVPAASATLAPLPQITIAASGELTPFSLTIRRTGTPARITITVAEDGRIAASELQESGP